MPQACSKMLGQKDPSQLYGVPDPPPPVVQPLPTTPPTFAVPDTAPPPGPAPPPGVPQDLVKARAAQDAKDYKTVKRILEAKVRAGKATPEEAQMVYDACAQLKDKTCTAMVRKTYPSLP